MKTMLAACLLMVCGSSEDFADDYTSCDLYAIVKPDVVVSKLDEMFYSIFLRVHS
ncbi:MAG: hypothetical protein IKR05_07900 [Prevotella sp.]|nr:hypothetical protein [Prevotella sp.]MBR6263125.1 hypothetical protein [Prevotella sp.]